MCVLFGTDCMIVTWVFGCVMVAQNNACQTIRRPAAYYQHMISGEREASSTIEADTLRPMLANHVSAQHDYPQK